MPQSARPCSTTNGPLKEHYQQSAKKQQCEHHQQLLCAVIRSYLLKLDTAASCSACCFPALLIGRPVDRAPLPKRLPPPTLQVALQADS